ncbi:serine/threonine protein kinase [Elasticomyces elasticus]|uniref:Serine/threonine protein kinase n=1 Tax=Exophiala sideris TaxID=1016849 RepID=A0ABR0JAR7_9EURO|nr:serine/threonine protein kinase [Elasticomyces elasticus]KAK5026130.1 serine/threonine protein kinase [Exophiala sideris]KAK5032384.1 serine/threonine protein kinase [Exophiala sideris]KAK5059540.1 serine/threonine protein kinase [Exophiala sideris]KAK5186702.1 serine/threonine protein kinase [Eurotiomycetes sp. CCFEE 6388]
MAPKKQQSSLKRNRHSTGGDDQELKKPRRSNRLSSQPQKEPHTPKDPKQQTPIKNQYLPSPLTNHESTATEPNYKEQTATPPEGRPSQIRHVTPLSSPQLNALSSPPQDTQILSQFVYPPRDIERDLDDDDGNWGYLFPLKETGHRLIMKRRAFCPAPSNPLEISRTTVKSKKKGKKQLEEDEVQYEEDKRIEGFPAGGYLIGRHPECDMVLDIPTVSNRHCLLFNETRNGDSIAVLEDLSSNGTFVNEALVGRNKRRELEDGDEITILDEARFVFRYPKNRDSSAFNSQYRILQQLGKGHFATVYLCVDRSSGFKYAVKKFERRMGESQKSQTEGLQQEIALLMSVSHPNVLCLKETFDEQDGVYLVLELAAEGELFNLIVTKQKLTEEETRKIFIQLFQGTKYLHERNIVHRDIKPENILLTDKVLSVKLADFGLAKIIGEESFTTTLCGTPSYVAPEILENTRHRKYTKAVDIWSLGVVLYICLCGFPPFSDELYSKDNPYTLAQQIKMGRFDYPSPYWDSIGDPALDLIDHMLTVDVAKRYTVDQCMEHPWTRNAVSAHINPADSTDGLTGAMHSLDFSKRKINRERTLLANINDVKVSKVVEIKDARVPGRGTQDAETTRVKVWEKNLDGKIAIATDTAPEKNNKKKEEDPAANRQQEEFMGMGGKGDMQLFGDDISSRYLPEEVPDTQKSAT